MVFYSFIGALLKCSSIFCDSSRKGYNNSIALQICGSSFFFTKPKQWIKIVLKLKCSQTVYMRMNWVVNLWKYTPPPPPYIHWKLQTVWERVKLLWLTKSVFWRFQWSLRPCSVLSRACIPRRSRAADQHSEEDSESSVWWVLWIVSILQFKIFIFPLHNGSVIVVIQWWQFSESNLYRICMICKICGEEIYDPTLQGSKILGQKLKIDAAFKCPLLYLGGTYHLMMIKRNFSSFL